MARLWRCNCADPAANTHPESVAACPACGAVTPYADTMPADARDRFVGFLDWLDARMAERPGITGSMMGNGAAAIIRAAKSDPDSRFATLAAYADGLAQVCAWVREGTPPDEAAIDRMLDELGGKG